MSEFDPRLGRGEENLSSGQQRIILIRGLPGSGKSTIAQELASLLGNVSLLDPDRIDYNGPEYSDFVLSLRRRLPSLDFRYFPYRFLLHKARLALARGEDIIWCQPFSNQQGLFDTIETLGIYASGMNLRPDVTIIDIGVNPDTALSRVRARRSNGGHGPDEESFRNFVGRFCLLSENSLPPGCRYLYINGEGDIGENVCFVYGTIVGGKGK